MKRIFPLFLAFVPVALCGQVPARRTIDVAHSRMTVYVQKQGLFSFLADNHVIDVPIQSGTFDAQQKSIELTVDAANLRVLDPALPSNKRDDVQANMVGPRVLDVAKYPTIIFRSTAIDGTGKGTWSVAGNLQLHGQTHPVDLRVVSDGAGHFTGSTTLRQSAFGITPIKIAAGAVSVKDDVRLEFSIACCVSP